jgi:hypothetical protein
MTPYEAVDVIEQLALYDANAQRRTQQQLQQLFLAPPSAGKVGSAVLALGMSEANKTYGKALRTVQRELTKMGV